MIATAESDVGGESLEQPAVQGPRSAPTGAGAGAEDGGKTAGNSGEGAMQGLRSSRAGFAGAREKIDRDPD